jgi:FtsK/SpoIIIE family
MDERNSLQPVRTTSPMVAFWSFVGAIVFLIALVAGMIAAWSRFTAGANIVATILIVLSVVIVPGAVLVGIAYGVLLLWKSHKRKERLAELQLQFAAIELAKEQDALRRENEQHAMQLQIVNRTINFDDQGNAALFDASSGQIMQLRGQYREHPNLSSYHNAPKVTSVAEEKQAQIGPVATEVRKVTFEDACNQVQRNSFQVCLGWDTKERQYIVEELNGAHFLLIGGTRKGKSCQAGQIIDQMSRTHDREHLLISLLDLEDLTCNLFTGLPHIAKITVGNRTIKSIARSHEEVVTHLGYLVQLMDYRYHHMTPRERDNAPKVLVYLEEFMELKRRLRSKPDVLKKLSDDFTTLASRGIKAGIHLMVCAQASYSQEEFREAMGQFIGVNMGFCANPRLAQAAGFSNFELLKENYQAKQAGQFVIEGTFNNTIGIAPEYNVKAKLLAMQDAEELRLGAPGAHTFVEEEQDGLEGENEHRLLAFKSPQDEGAHLVRTQDAPESAHPIVDDDTAWQAYINVIEQLQEEGKNQDTIIEIIWHTKKGSGNAKYLSGREIYRKCNAHLKEQRQQMIDDVLRKIEG